MIPKNFKDLVKDTRFDLNLFEECLETEAPTSIRIKKSNPPPFNLKNKVDWCFHSFYLDERPVFTLDPYFHGGCYYVQEASSMFLWYCLNQLNLKKDDLKILDLCAAPGGKSTLILDFLEGKGILVSNEVINLRSRILSDNIKKWSSTNTIVANGDPLHFKKLKNMFDVVVIDAPCSGEGMWRKDKKSVKEWSLDHVALCSSRQKRIVDDVISSIKDGGYLIYSTCTFNHLENIDNVEWMMKSFDLESVKLTIPEEWDLDEIKSSDSIGYQFYPFSGKGEGFFIAIMRKKGDLQYSEFRGSRVMGLKRDEEELIDKWVKFDKKDHTIIKAENGTCYLTTKRAANGFNELRKKIRVIQTGLPIGQIKKRIFIPDHGLALSPYVRKEIPRVNLCKYQALDYLRKNLTKIDSYQKGWMLACYEDIPIGWLKNLGNRINNYLPKEFKIRNL